MLACLLLSLSLLLWGLEREYIFFPQKSIPWPTPTLSWGLRRRAFSAPARQARSCCAASMSSSTRLCSRSGRRAGRRGRWFAGWTNLVTDRLTAVAKRKGTDPSGGRAAFWDDLFMLKVNEPFLEASVDKLAPEALLQIKVRFWVSNGRLPADFAAPSAPPGHHQPALCAVHRRPAGREPRARQPRAAGAFPPPRGGRCDSWRVPLADPRRPAPGHFPQEAGRLQPHQRHGGL